jgi:hypothetical protein
MYKLLVIATIFSAFFLSQTASANLEGEELQRVEAFLDLLSTKTDLTFVRNGTNYKVDDAVSHLKSKLGRAKRKVSTAEEFIDKVASSSSISGRPYLIIKPDGETVEAKEYFHELLKELEK